MHGQFIHGFFASLQRDSLAAAMLRRDHYGLCGYLFEGGGAAMRQKILAFFRGAR
jgi:hypothetical protein